jgi:hypothetical protein
MNKREKIGCTIAALQFLVVTPLSYIYTFLLLRHINATDALWLLFWINLPLALIVSVVFKYIEIFLSEKD